MPKIEELVSKWKQDLHKNSGSANKVLTVEEIIRYCENNTSNGLYIYDKLKENLFSMFNSDSETLILLATTLFTVLSDYISIQDKKDIYIKSSKYLGVFLRYPNKIKMIRDLMNKISVV